MAPAKCGPLNKKERRPILRRMGRRDFLSRSLLRVGVGLLRGGSFSLELCGPLRFFLIHNVMVELEHQRVVLGGRGDLPFFPADFPGPPFEQLMCQLFPYGFKPSA